jgi:anti-sigma regulatory factor (Ser/Thr protein kinase)
MIWSQQPLPDVDNGARSIGRWRVIRPSDVTSSRIRLRTSLERVCESARLDEEALERLLLGFEELASNGLRHGEAPVDIEVIVDSECCLLVVTDAASDRPPVPVADRDPALGGMGLHLVARLSRSYGWSATESCKQVWACIAPPPCSPSSFDLAAAQHR